MTKIFVKPSEHVEVKLENLEEGRIVEIVDYGRDYEVRSYKLIGGEYRLHDSDRAPNYTCAILQARHFCKTGSVL